MKTEAEIIEEAIQFLRAKRWGSDSAIHSYQSVIDRDGVHFEVAYVAETEMNKLSEQARLAALEEFFDMYRVMHTAANMLRVAEGNYVGVLSTSLSEEPSWYGTLASWSMTK